MVGQFNIPGWDPTTMTYTQPTRSVASITKGASPEVLQTVKDMMSRTPSAMVQQSTVTPEKAQILDQIFNRQKNIFLDTKPSVVSKELSSVIKEAGGVKPKTLNQRLTTLEKELGNFYKKAMPTLAKPSKKAVATGLKAGRVAGKIGLPLAVASTLGTLIGDNPTDEKVAAGLSLLGTAGMAGGKSPYITIPSAILAFGSSTYPLWADKVKGKLNELEANKQLAKKQELPTEQQVEGSEEIITEPVPNVGQWDGTRVDGVTNFVNGLTSGSDVQQNATNTNVSAPEATQQQFVYETPAAKNEVLDFMEQFARQYPAMQEQDRRRQMQAALLAPVINNDRFVNAALGQGQVATTAKQLELLNTAANARVSEAQRPLLAQAFVKAGMPAELAYASEDQLKSIANVLVTGINRDSARYKANMAAQLGKYKADLQLEGVKIATAAKQGPEKLIQVLGQAGYSTDEINDMLQNVYGSQWKSMIGRPTNITFGRDTENEVYNIPEQKDYFNY